MGRRSPSSSSSRSSSSSSSSSSDSSRSRRRPSRSRSRSPRRRERSRSPRRRDDRRRSPPRRRSRSPPRRRPPSSSPPRRRPPSRSPPRGRDDRGRSPPRYDAPPPRRPPPRRLPELRSIHRGTVARIQPFGAFVRIDNYADGLVHISQLRDERVETVADAVREGEYVWVVVTDIKEGNKVSLSMRLVDQETGELKETLNDVDAATPSARGTGELPQLYSVHKGTVARIQNFGAFVRIDNYGDGLVHVSQLCAYRVEDPNDVVDVGQKVRRPLHAVDARRPGVRAQVYVKVVEHREANKVSLSMKVVDQATGEDLDPANRDYQARGEGGGGRRGNAPIRAGDEVDPVEAMRKGTADPRNQRFASGGDYELVDDDEPAPPPPAAEPIGRGRGATMPAWMQTLKADVGKDLRRKEKKRERKEAKKRRKKEKKAAKKAKKREKKSSKKEKKSSKKRKRDSSADARKDKKSKKERYADAD